MNIAQRALLDPAVKNYISMPRKLLIDGKWVEAVSGKTFPVYDPSTGTVLAQVAEADAADVEKAVTAARKAFDEGPWPRMSPSERGRALWKLADLLEARTDQFAWGVLAWNVAVVLWGAFVRASGSGAGCGRHWPVCNGQVIPHSPSAQTLIELTHRAMTGIDSVLVLYSAETNAFDDEEVKLLEELAGDVSFALTFIAQQKRVDYLAYYDTLTGLPNRTLFFNRLDQHLARALVQFLAAAL